MPFEILKQRYEAFEGEITRGDSGKVSIGIDKRTKQEVTLDFGGEGKQVVAIGASGGGKTEILRRIAAELFQNKSDCIVFVVDRKDMRKHPFMEYLFEEPNTGLKRYLEKYDKTSYSLPTKRYIPRPKKKPKGNKCEFKIPYRVIRIDMIEEFFHINERTRYWRRVYDILRRFEKLMERYGENPSKFEKLIKAYEKDLSKPRKVLLKCAIDEVCFKRSDGTQASTNISNNARDVFYSIFDDDLFGDVEFEPERDKINVLDLRPSQRKVLTAMEDVFYVGAWICMIYRWWTEIPKNERPPILIVIDEAHNYFKRDRWTLAKENLIKLLREGRTQGISVVLATQYLDDVDQNLLKGSRWWLIIGYLASTTDINLIVKLSETKKTDLKLPMVRSLTEERKFRKKMRGSGRIIEKGGYPWEVMYYVAPTR